MKVIRIHRVLLVDLIIVLSGEPTVLELVVLLQLQVLLVVRLNKQVLFMRAVLILIVL